MSEDSDCNCYKCKTTEKPLLLLKIEDEDGNVKDAWICMKHLFMQIMDTGMKHMQNNMSEYAGDLFDYKDDFNK